MIGILHRSQNTWIKFIRNFCGVFDNFAVVSPLRQTSFPFLFAALWH